MLDKVKEMISKNYKEYSVNWTYERSQGNYCDCFEDGYESGYSNALYDIACLIGLDLPYPEPEEE